MITADDWRLFYLALVNGLYGKNRTEQGVIASDSTLKFCLSIIQVRERSRYKSEAVRPFLESKNRSQCMFEYRES